MTKRWRGRERERELFCDTERKRLHEIPANIDISRRYEEDIKVAVLCLHHRGRVPLRRSGE